MSERYIVVRGWEKFQHYSDRAPKWIKIYPELLSNEDYLRLSGHDRSILAGIWLEYASSQCRLPLDTRSLSRRLSLRVTMASLERLNDAGWIEFSASKPLAGRYPRQDKTRHPYGIDKETETVGSTDVELPIALPSGEEHLVDRLLGEIRDADGRTELAVKAFRRRLPEAAFAMALESLQYRRAKEPPLVSEAKYVVAALKTMEAERVPF